MINFIVLEDNVQHAKRTKNIILNYMMKNKHEFDILYYDRMSNEFLNFVKTSDDNNIFILDFELINTTAIDVAREIRKYDWVSPIIVFSVNGGMAYETFKQRIQILDFVNKQFEAEKNLHELFDICFSQFKLRKGFKYRIGKVDYSIPYDSILYIYKDTFERKSKIVTDTKEHTIPLSLIKIKGLLTDDFIYTHKACIVNKRRVNAYVWRESKVVFDNGMETHFLSKVHKKELQIDEIV